MNAFTQFKEGSIYEPVIQLDNVQIRPREGVEVIRADKSCGCGGCAVVLSNENRTHYQVIYERDAQRFMDGQSKGYFAATWDKSTRTFTVLDRAPHQVW